MSLGKLPAIKGLVSTSQSRRRFKSELSVDMISPPLGDFRHTMHVGRGGDVFGDTSFLSNYGGSGHSDGLRCPDLPPGSKTTRFLSRTLQHVRKTPAPRLRGGSRDFSSPPPPISPIIKNAISLPQLNLSNGGLMRAMLHTSTSSPDRPLCSYGQDSGSVISPYSMIPPILASPNAGLPSGFVTLPRFSRLDQSFAEALESPRTDSRRSSEVSVSPSDSLSSFTVDLGPSLMTEVLEIIDNSCCLLKSHEEEEDQRSAGSDRENQLSDDLVRRSVTADVAIEPKRFQQAASMLARHFGGRAEEERQRPSSFRHTRMPYSFTETEEEIKV